MFAAQLHTLSHTLSPTETISRAGHVIILLSRKITQTSQCVKRNHAADYNISLKPHRVSQYRSANCCPGISLAVTEYNHPEYVEVTFAKPEH